MRYGGVLLCAHHDHGEHVSECVIRQCFGMERFSQFIKSALSYIIIKKMYL